MGLLRAGILLASEVEGISEALGANLDMAEVARVLLAEECISGKASGGTY
jgi:hypothetical protein